MKFCCKDFFLKDDGRFIEFFVSDRGSDCILYYDKRYRHYAASYSKEFGYHISHCPWCGKKLPEDLYDKWWDVLEKEYGITDPRNDDEAKVPPEFWTDEWWIKRGL